METTIEGLQGFGVKPSNRIFRDLGESDPCIGGGWACQLGWRFGAGRTLPEPGVHFEDLRGKGD